MFHLLSVLAQLPRVRKALFVILFLAGLADFFTSIILLAYQLALTTGFNRVVPSLVVTSFLTSAIPAWFVLSKPYAIRLPISSAAVPAVGSKRDKVARFTRSIAAELVSLGGVGAWTLITVADLHAETPGLIDSCGGWTICRMLLAVFALTWITFLFQALSFATLLASTLYFTIRRSSPIPMIFTSFDDVDWIRYSGRPVNRAATVKRVKQAKANTSTVPEDFAAADGELKAPPANRFGHGRAESEVPVLAQSIHSFGRDSVVDWDVQSAFSGRNALRDSTATHGAPSVAEQRPEQVFVLMCTEKEDESSNEKATTGTAL
ncbi:hypothetical protein JCM10212_006082 [Sporobolomyces blumeae]